MEFIKQQLNNTLENETFDIKGEFYKGKEEVPSDEHIRNVVTKGIEKTFENRLENVRENMKKNHNNDVYENIENKIKEFIQI